jgi:hypothetical protein
MMQTTPTHASQVILPKVCMLQKTKPMTAATATKTAVQAPWSESAFRAMEMLSIPEPATKIQSCLYISSAGWSVWERIVLTENISYTHYFLADATKQHLTNIVNAVYFWMPQFEGTNHVIWPSGYYSNGEETNDTGYHSEAVEDRWNWKYSQANLRFHHESHTAQPPDLSIISL